MVSEFARFAGGGGSSTEDEEERDGEEGDSVERDERALASALSGPDDGAEPEPSPPQRGAPRGQDGNVEPERIREAGARVAQAAAAPPLVAGRIGAKAVRAGVEGVHRLREFEEGGEERLRALQDRLGGEELREFHERGQESRQRGRRREAELSRSVRQKSSFAAGVGVGAVREGERQLFEGLAEQDETVTAPAAPLVPAHPAAAAAVGLGLGAAVSARQELPSEEIDIVKEEFQEGIEVGEEIFSPEQAVPADPVVREPEVAVPADPVLDMAEVRVPEDQFSPSEGVPVDPGVVRAGEAIPETPSTPGGVTEPTTPTSPTEPTIDDGVVERPVVDEEQIVQEDTDPVVEEQTEPEVSEEIEPETVELVEEVTEPELVEAVEPGVAAEPRPVDATLPDPGELTEGELIEVTEPLGVAEPVGIGTVDVPTIEDIDTPTQSPTDTVTEPEFPTPPENVTVTKFPTRNPIESTTPSSRDRKRIPLLFDLPDLEAVDPDPIERRGFDAFRREFVLELEGDSFDLDLEGLDDSLDLDDIDVV